MRDPLAQFETSRADITRQKLNEKSLLQRLSDAQNDLGLSHIAVLVKHSEDKVRITLTLKQFEEWLALLEAAALSRSTGDQVHQEGKLF